jgi:hypothetical protein
MSLPPAFAAGALYDKLLQSALRRFFDRATFETEAMLSASSDGRLAIEPTSDPAALTVRFFGSRHTLRVPPRRPFTRDEVRLAQAIGAVLAARYRVIFDPRLLAARGDLFSGAIEDRYVGAYLAGGQYKIGQGENRADRIATAIEVLRVAALSSYENRAISSGVLLLDGDAPAGTPSRVAPEGALHYSPALTAIKSFYRLCDGTNTLFLVDREGVVLDIVEVSRWADAHGRSPMKVPGAAPYVNHARATAASGDVCIVLSPSHEIKVFADGSQVFTFRNAGWHLLDIAAKYEMWAEALGDRAFAKRIFQIALDLADARQGALFVVLRDPQHAVPRLVAPADRLDSVGDVPVSSAVPSRRDLMYLVANRNVTEFSRAVLEALATMDGATVMDQSGRLLAVGAILRHVGHGEVVVEGARTTAAISAAQFGPVLKVSEDGVVTFFDGERIWDI